MKRRPSIARLALVLSAGAAVVGLAMAANEDQKPTTSAVILERAKSTRIDNRKGMAWLEDAVIVHDGARIAADRIELDTNKGLGTASGHIEFEREGVSVTSESARADFRGRRAVFEGTVRFVMERAAGEGTTPEKTAMTCAKLEYFYRQRKGVATGPVRVEQADQWAAGDAATYDGEAETFAIVGSVKVENNRGETFECSKATLSLKDDTIDLDGPGTGRFLIEEESSAGR